jgi:hypothetical protein
LKTISISDQSSSLLENNSEGNHINKIEDELESKESVTTIDDESNDENGSEYEDVEEDEIDEINDTSILTSITNKNPFKVKIIIFYLISFSFFFNLRQL